MPRPSKLMTPQPMRQSCDRCHKQKLGCKRTGDRSTGACDRCLRKSLPCVYSSSLPKGRPSLYQLSNNTRASKSDAGPASTVSTETGGEKPTIPADSKSPLSPVQAQDKFTNSEITSTSENNSDSMITDWNPSPADDISIHQQSKESHPSIVSDSSSWIDAISWDDLHLGWTNQASNELLFPAGPLFKPFDNNGAIANNNPMLSSHWDVGAPESKDNVKSLDHSQSDSPTVAEALPHFPPPLRSDLQDTDARLTGLVKADEIVTAISELAQLSVRLSSLQRSSHSRLGGISGGLKLEIRPTYTPLVDESSFESVAAWVVQSSNKSSILTPLGWERRPQSPHLQPSPLHEVEATGSLLNGIFSASHCFLEIIRYLHTTRATTQAEFSSSSSSRGTTPPTSMSGERSYFTSKSTSPSQPCTPSEISTWKSTNDLVISCHMALLSIYSDILEILEFDACYQNEHSTHVTGIGNLRMFFVLQLCYYFLNRQQQSTDELLGNNGRFPVLTVSGFSYISPHWTSRSDGATQFASGGGEIMDTMIGIQDKLMRIGQTLKM